MVVIFGRMFIGTLTCIPLMWRLRPAQARRSDLLWLLLMCLCEPCLYFIFEAKALLLTSASQAGMITAMLPLMVAVGAMVFLREKVTRKTLSGFSLAIIGACGLSWAAVPDHSAPDPVLGNFFEFVAMVCATGYTLVLKKLSDRYHPFFLTGGQAVVGAVFFGLLVFFLHRSGPWNWHPAGVAAIAYLGIAVTVGAYGLYNFGVSRIPANQASVFINLIPVFTLILGWTILQESLTPVQYVASALVLVGVVLSQDRTPETDARACVSGGSPPAECGT